MTTSPVQRSPVRVLIIDDSPLVAALVRDALEAAGYAVGCAHDGAAGLALAERDDPAVVLCDLDMPGMSGLEVMERLRARTPLTPVLIFTDSNELSSAVAAMRAGAFGYVTKGSSSEVLLGELHRAVSHRLMLERNRELELINERHQRELEQLVAEKTKEITRLQQARAQAERLAAMGSFVAGVAHEINNPLAVVRSNTVFLKEVLAGLAVSHDVRQATDELEVCATRIQRIVESLNLFARRGTRKAVGCELRGAIDEAKLVCSARVPPSIPVSWALGAGVAQVALSKDDLVLVLSNLVVNGAHAVESKGAQGSVEVKVHGSDGWVVVEVVDTGCGIPQEHLARVFDPFFTTKPPGRGTGLGLSLVHQVVQNAQGELKISSEPGRGTSVTVRLPREAHAEPSP